MQKPLYEFIPPDELQSQPCPNAGKDLLGVNAACGNYCLNSSTSTCMEHCQPSTTPGDESASATSGSSCDANGTCWHGMAPSDSLEWTLIHRKGKNKTTEMEAIARVPEQSCRGNDKVTTPIRSLVDVLATYSLAKGRTDKGSARRGSSINSYKSEPIQLYETRGRCCKRLTRSSINTARTGYSPTLYDALSGSGSKLGTCFNSGSTNLLLGSFSTLQSEDRTSSCDSDLWKLDATIDEPNLTDAVGEGDGDEDMIECTICNKPVSKQLAVLTLKKLKGNHEKGSAAYLQDSYVPIYEHASEETHDRQTSCSTGSFEAFRCGDSHADWIATETCALLKTVASALFSTEYGLNNLVERITPTKNCRADKLYLYNTIKRFLRYCLGDDTKVYLVGSTGCDIDIDYSSLLSVPSYSDLDLEVISPRFGFNTRAILRQIFNTFCETQSVLKATGINSPWAIGNMAVKLVDSAKVPIVIMRTKSGVLCDISVNTSKSLRHNDLFLQYIEKHGMLRNFMRLIKHWLRFRGIPSMKEGGFPTIFWMLIFCNVVDTSEMQRATNGAAAPSMSAIFEMLRDHQVLKGDLEKLVPGDLTFMAALEQSFNMFAQGTNLIEMVNAATLVGGRGGRIGGGGPYKNWFMGEIGYNIMTLIEMESNFPYTTWLVYYYEIYRAEKSISKYSKYVEILVSLVVCLRAHATFNSSNKHAASLDELRGLVRNVQKLFGYNLSHLVRERSSVTDNLERHVQQVARVLNIKLNSTQMMESARMLINYVIQQFSSIAMDIFAEAFDKVYSIPACIEPPTPLITQQEPRRSKDAWCMVPTFEGTMWCDSGWFIVMLDGKLQIVKALKVCVNWDSWWSTQFLSRRDAKSVFHGFVYCQISVAIAGECMHTAPEGEVPSVLVRRGGLVLFHPCDIVSRLYVIKVTKSEQSISSRYYSYDMFTGARALYVMPGFEVERLKDFSQVRARVEAQDAAAEAAQAAEPAPPALLGQVQRVLQEHAAQPAAHGAQRAGPATVTFNVIYHLKRSQQALVRHDALDVPHAEHRAERHHDELDERVEEQVQLRLVRRADAAEVAQPQELVLGVDGVHVALELAEARLCALHVGRPQHRVLVAAGLDRQADGRHPVGVGELELVHAGNLGLEGVDAVAGLPLVDGVACAGRADDQAHVDVLVARKRVEHAAQERARLAHVLVEELRSLGGDVEREDGARVEALHLLRPLVEEGVHEPVVLLVLSGGALERVLRAGGRGRHDALVVRSSRSALGAFSAHKLGVPPVHFVGDGIGRRDRRRRRDLRAGGLGLAAARRRRQRRQQQGQRPRQPRQTHTRAFHRLLNDLHLGSSCGGAPGGGGARAYAVRPMLVRPVLDDRGGHEVARQLLDAHQQLVHERLAELPEPGVGRGLGVELLAVELDQAQVVQHLHQVVVAARLALGLEQREPHGVLDDVVVVGRDALGHARREGAEARLLLHHAHRLRHQLEHLLHLAAEVLHRHAAHVHGGARLLAARGHQRALVEGVQAVVRLLHRGLVGQAALDAGVLAAAQPLGGVPLERRGAGGDLAVARVVVARLLPGAHGGRGAAAALVALVEGALGVGGDVPALAAGAADAAAAGADVAVHVVLARGRALHPPAQELAQVLLAVDEDGALVAEGLVGGAAALAEPHDARHGLELVHLGHALLLAEGAGALRLAELAKDLELAALQVVVFVRYLVKCLHEGVGDAVGGVLGVALPGAVAVGGRGVVDALAAAAAGVARAVERKLGGALVVEHLLDVAGDVPGRQVQQLLDEADPGGHGLLLEVAVDGHLEAEVELLELALHLVAAEPVGLEALGVAALELTQPLVHLLEALLVLALLVLHLGVDAADVVGVLQVEDAHGGEARPARADALEGADQLGLDGGVDHALEVGGALAEDGRALNLLEHVRDVLLAQQGAELLAGLLAHVLHVQDGADHEGLEHPGLQQVVGVLHVALGGGGVDLDLGLALAHGVDGDAALPRQRAEAHDDLLVRAGARQQEVRGADVELALVGGARARVDEDGRLVEGALQDGLAIAGLDGVLDAEEVDAVAGLAERAQGAQEGDVLLVVLLVVVDVVVDAGGHAAVGQQQRVLLDVLEERDLAVVVEGEVARLDEVVGGVAAHAVGAVRLVGEAGHERAAQQRARGPGGPLEAVVAAEDAHVLGEEAAAEVGLVEAHVVVLGGLAHQWHDAGEVLGHEGVQQLAAVGAHAVLAGVVRRVLLVVLVEGLVEHGDVVVLAELLGHLAELDDGVVGPGLLHVGGDVLDVAETLAHVDQREPGLLGQRLEAAAPHVVVGVDWGERRHGFGSSLLRRRFDGGLGLQQIVLVGIYVVLGRHHSVNDVGRVQVVDGGAHELLDLGATIVEQQFQVRLPHPVQQIAAFLGGGVHGGEAGAAAEDLSQVLHAPVLEELPQMLELDQVRQGERVGEARSETAPLVDHVAGVEEFAELRAVVAEGAGHLAEEVGVVDEGDVPGHAGVGQPGGGQRVHGRGWRGSDVVVGHVEVELVVQVEILRRGVAAVGATRNPLEQFILQRVHHVAGSRGSGVRSGFVGVFFRISCSLPIALRRVRIGIGIGRVGKFRLELNLPFVIERRIGGHGTGASRLRGDRPLWQWRCQRCLLGRRLLPVGVVPNAHVAFPAVAGQLNVAHKHVRVAPNVDVLHAVESGPDESHFRVISVAVEQAHIAHIRLGESAGAAEAVLLPANVHAAALTRRNVLRRGLERLGLTRSLLLRGPAVGLGLGGHVLRAHAGFGIHLELRAALLQFAAPRLQLARLADLNGGRDGLHVVQLGGLLLQRGLLGHQLAQTLQRRLLVHERQHRHHQGMAGIRLPSMEVPPLCIMPIDIMRSMIQPPNAVMLALLASGSPSPLFSVPGIPGTGAGGKGKKPGIPGMPINPGFRESGAFVSPADPPAVSTPWLGTPVAPELNSWAGTVETLGREASGCEGWANGRGGAPAAGPRGFVGFTLPLPSMAAAVGRRRGAWGALRRYGEAIAPRWAIRGDDHNLRKDSRSAAGMASSNITRV
ncbi:erythrocyte membrane-associated antigen, putative [Babesia caballi]|uniref:Erythrocyte membrane-associated antigen, putative n=1 Tax=Babesia caballi TaxID=5871 RepID=A0AAV4M338_BABCB|nr:erythrocyte membrane-associated antigen, putative [Babesia caballi]